MPRNRVQHQKGLSDDAFERLYPDEEACRKAWLAWRWPEGFHYRVDLAEFTAVDLGGYLRVNARFAEALSRFIQPGDSIWVHDYHLLSLAKRTPRAGPRQSDRL